MKKVMILGGGQNQLGLLHTAKECGYRVILCDKNQNCVGKPIADIFYKVDIIDTEALVKVAKYEKIDGVVSNSEAVMENVADISSELGLIGNSRESIEILNSKQAFRDYQKKIGVIVPKHIVLNSISDLQEALKDFKYPIIVKPVKCSGTRGTTRFDKYSDEIKNAVVACINYSRDKRCAIEEFIEMPSLAVLEGDIFINGEDIFWGGLFFTQRSEKLPMVPMTYMSPYLDSKSHMDKIKKILECTFHKLPITHGQYNVEAYFDKNDDLFIIEINARQGGHGLPAYVKLATGVDMDKMLITTAVGDNDYFTSVIEHEVDQKYATRHAVFGDEDGILEKIYIDDLIRQYVVGIEYDKKIGEHVEKRINGSSVIGFVNLVFDSYTKQHEFSENIEQHIYPLIK